MAPAALDGSLSCWDDIKKVHRWSALFLGNGLSINVWPDFGYKSLFDEAKTQLDRGALLSEDRELFAAHDTTNFEVVLAALNTSIRTLEALGYETGFLLTSYASIQAALGEAVRSVHVTLTDMPDHTRATIQRVLSEQKLCSPRATIC